MTELTDVVVVSDGFTWREEVPGTSPKQYLHHHGWRGETVSLPPKALARGLALNAVARAADAPAAAAENAAVTDAVAAGPDGDAELMSWPAPDLVGYLVQHPEEAQRVFALERERRRGARATVVRAAGYDPDTMEPLAGAPAGSPPGF